ncbi:nucleoside deaminase [Photobacterium sp.]|uniref:nucleoside deaminase n=1 Tax=Photobacterium sp. TaxID=660 RepID=UPI00299D5FD3|nr:nucleoside deaminase [Photobacterium sp.]MDX1301432.1 nucleoside deaminase [Photobacterium sp.]
MQNQNPFLEEALILARNNVAQGGRPFGAVVVRDGKVVSRGVNRMLENNDPTAHAELLALREAGQVLNSTRLDGCSVYASGQPCPMCLAAIRMSGITEVVYAYSNDQAEPYNLSTANIAKQLSLPLDQQSWASIKHIPQREYDKEDLYELWASHSSDPN